MAENIGTYIYWDPGKFNSWDDFQFQDTVAAADFLRHSRLDLVFNVMTTLENAPVSTANTKAILEGKYSGGLSDKNRNKVLAFGETLDLLSAALSKNLFKFDWQALSILHRRAAICDVRGDELGKLRTSPVALGSLSFKPPVSVALPGVWKQGFEKIRNIKNPLEAAMISFLWLARMQFFTDCNKRTAFLGMTGFLAANARPFIPCLESDKKSFEREIKYFYEGGNADRMIELFGGYYNQIAQKAREYENVREYSGMTPGGWL